MSLCYVWNKKKKNASMVLQKCAMPTFYSGNWDVLLACLSLWTKPLVTISAYRLLKYKHYPQNWSLDHFTYSSHRLRMVEMGRAEDVQGHWGVHGDTRGCCTCRAHGDVWISETLHADEIPREPRMDNVIWAHRWCRNQMERGAFRLCCLSVFNTHTHTHTHAPV